MNKHAYRRRYITLTREYNRIIEPYNCGEHLAGYINPRIRVLRHEIDALVAEIEREMDNAAHSQQ